jgi:hypothetical protein
MEEKMDYSKLALEKHAEWKGKLSVESKAPITNREELSVAYTPGVAAPCLEIQKDEELAYTYEVIEDPEQMPQEAYSRKATEKLTNVLYTRQNGLYKYEADDVIPEGKSEGDIYGINAVTGIRAEDGAIVIDIMTQAYDDGYMQKITDDNTAAAELFDCKFREGDSVPRFLNEKDSLYRTFRTTFYKVNGTTNANTVLATESDNYFTPCSYLAEKNENADIIHLRLNSAQAQITTNSILCYIAYKGNILF